jgi:hypothetical protein
MSDLNYIESTALIIATPFNFSPFNLEIHDTNQATGTTYLSTNIKTGAHTGRSDQAREIRNQGLFIISASLNSVRGWDRTNLSTAPNLWNYSAVNTIRGLASKPGTTWFLAGSDLLSIVYRC